MLIYIAFLRTLHRIDNELTKTSPELSDHSPLVPGSLACPTTRSPAC